MLDFHAGAWDATKTPPRISRGTIRQVPRSTVKRICDGLTATTLLALLLPIACILIVLNPLFNRGPLWFYQKRMGRNCDPFVVVKFRTMTTQSDKSRGAFDALDKHRITALGRFLRKTRIDELPQIINVLRGEMSMIGPRPDAYDHAQVYLQTIPGYRARHAVLPGISGLAQVEVGYVDGREGVMRKVAADIRYIAAPSLRQELWIAWRTFFVIFGRRGH